MKILFTTSDKRFSTLIRDITREDISHCAIELPVGVIIHSNFRGLHLQSSRSFRRNNKIVYEIPVFTDISIQRDRLNDLFDEYEFSYYDIGALLFLGFSLLARQYLKLPLPKSNLWQSTGMFLCTAWITKYVEDKEDEMITPKKLYLKLKDMKDRGLLD